MSAALLRDDAREKRTRLGMWVFLASEIMFFGPVFLGYMVGRYHAPLGFAEAGRSTELLLGAANTLILLTSSLAMALAIAFFKEGRPGLARYALWATGTLGLLFIIIKGWEYRLDWHKGLVPGPAFHLPGATDQTGAQLFYFVYYFGTSLHALHLLVGIGLVWAGARCFTREPAAQAARRLETIGLYWHFVDIVWIFLFPALYLMGRAA